jgi:hypothetical protein
MGLSYVVVCNLKLVRITLREGQVRLLASLFLNLSILFLKR